MSTNSSVTKFVIFFLILGGFLSSTKIASAAIFDGGGGGGIFGGVQQSFNRIFDDLLNGVAGGAVIPGVQPTPPVGSIGRKGGETKLPPAPGSVKQVRLSLEWDALSLGGEAVEPVQEDPLRDLHRKYLVCPQCSSNSAFNSAVIDEYNRVLPAIDGKVLSAPAPNGSITPRDADDLTTTWKLCPTQTFCKLKNLEPVLIGWCGQEANVMNQARVPSESINSPGPNEYTLPNAVSNKYIRRDGYAYQCESTCSGDTTGTCVTDNYVEFQTMIYPSNAVSLYAKVENPTDLDVNNVLVRANTLSYSPQGEYPVPHNLDFPLEEFLPGSDSLFRHNDFSYAHGSTLENKIDDGINIIRTVDGINFSLQRNGTGEPELAFGPFNLKPHEIKNLPLQPTLVSEYTRIPDTGASYDSESTMSKPNIPCTEPCENTPPEGLSGVGGIIPRDYNFICDPDDPVEWGDISRCKGTDPEVLIKPDDPRFNTYRDVTGIGGCGYNASSNNSVIGPVQIAAEYEGEGNNRNSRSIIIGSIPVGGRILDDQARPYGWPANGVISELWGYTSLADSNPSRANPTLEYGEYRYCAQNGL